MPNTAVDIVVVLVILLSAVLAFVRGFTREALALGTWLIACYLGFTQYPLLTPYLEDKVSNPMIRDFVGGLGVFALAMLVLIPLGFYLRSFIKGEQVTSIDRSFGFVFGALRGFILLSVFYLIVVWLLPEEKQPEWLKEANTRPALAYGAEIIRNIIPKEQRELMEKKPKDLAEGAEKNAESLPDTANKEELNNSLDKVMNELRGNK